MRALFVNLAVIAASVFFRSESAVAADKLVFVFQKQVNPAQMKPNADTVAKRLAEKLHTSVSAVVPGDYAASVQAIVSKTADIAYVDSMSYLLAARDGGASILLAEQRPDSTGAKRTDYDSVFVVRKDSPLKSFEDLVSQAKNLSIAFTSKSSTSGFLFPFRRFVQTGLVQPHGRVETAFRQVSFAGGYDLAVRAVLSGKADVAAVSNYAVEGASAKRYLKDEELSQIRVLARTPGVPTHMLIARSGLPQNELEQIRSAMLELSAQEPGLFADVYGASSFVPVTKEHVAATAEAVELAGVSLDKKKS